MPDLPPAPQRGEDVLSFIQRLMPYLRSLRPQSGSGTRAQWNAGGFSFNISPRKGSDTEQRHPFEVVAEGTDKVRVVPGTVNEFIPATVDGSDDEDWVFDIGEGEQFIVLRAEMSGDGAVSSAELSLEDEVPEQPEGNTETGSAPSGSYRVVARVNVASEEDGGGVRIENYLMGSQWVQCVVSQWNCDEQTVRALWAEQALLPT